jgi:hypothetical protein
MMLSHKFRLSTRLSTFKRNNPMRFCNRPMSSTIRTRSSTEKDTKSQEPLAQRLNIDNPETSHLRAETQAAQSKSENQTEPPTAETTDSASQPTHEPVAQKQNADEPPHDSLRGRTREAVSKSENVKDT